MSRFKFFRMCVAIVTFGLLATVRSANAVIIFQDDFQSDAAVLSDSTDDADPVIGAGDIGGVWNIIESPALAVQAENDLTPGTPGSGAGANNYIRVYRGGGTTSRGAPYAQGWNAADTLNQVVQLDMLVYQPTGTLGMSVFFGSALHSGNVNSGVNAFANVSPVQVSLDSNFPDDQWLSVQILANFSSSMTQLGILPQQYTLSINGGAPTTSNFAVSANQTPAILVGLSQTNETFNYIDNVSVQIVPEPSTFVLAGAWLTAMGLVTYRRKK